MLARVAGRLFGDTADLRGAHRRWSGTRLSARVPDRPTGLRLDDGLPARIATRLLAVARPLLGVAPGLFGIAPGLVGVAPHLFRVALGLLRIAPRLLGVATRLFASALPLRRGLAAGVARQPLGVASRPLRVDARLLGMQRRCAAGTLGLATGLLGFAPGAFGVDRGLFGFAHASLQLRADRRVGDRLVAAAGVHPVVLAALDRPDLRIAVILDFGDAGFAGLVGRMDRHAVRLRIARAGGRGHPVRHQRDQHDGGGQHQAAQLRGRSRVLQHDESPFQSGIGRRRAGDAGRRPRRHAEPQQQAAVVVRGIAAALQHGRVAGRFACDRVFPCDHMSERMKEEQVLDQGRHPAPPQVAAAHVDQFVMQRHRQFVGAELVHAQARQQHRLGPRADQLRRIDLRRQAQRRQAVQPEAVA